MSPDHFSWIPSVFDRLGKTILLLSNISTYSTGYNSLSVAWPTTVISSTWYSPPVTTDTREARSLADGYQGRAGMMQGPIYRFTTSEQGPLGGDKVTGGVRVIKER